LVAQLDCGRKELENIVMLALGLARFAKPMEPGKESIGIIWRYSATIALYTVFAVAVA